MGVSARNDDLAARIARLDLMAQHVRPRDQVFNMDYNPEGDQLEIGQKLVAQYHIRSLIQCSTCHR